MPPEPNPALAHTPVTIAITGGGTGGHVTPALAIAAQLTTLGHHVVYLGNPQSLEQTMATQKGYPFYPVPFRGMPRKPGLDLLRWGLQLLQAIGLARKQLQALNPTVVFGTGGYVAAPVLLAAKSLGIPYAIHEADAHPGLVNRLTARWAAHVTVAFDSAKAMLPNPHVTVTGNPIRQGLAQATQLQAAQQLKPAWLPQLQAGLPVVLVMGGSQGARRINTAVAHALPKLLPHCLLVHQTGGKLFDETMALVPTGYKDHPNYWLMPFIEDMPTMLSLATVALARAGSLTLSELFVAALPAVLVPYPYAAANHQFKNAQAVEQAGAAWIIRDDDLTTDHLIERLVQLLHSVDYRAQMVEAAKKLAKPHATVAITQQLCGLFGVVH
jgi:UDP-N-acetylglucosamine--N-acetylmuramyl-(pentapeptide) pyrophosphoryl-undecaprenol N-acetylglucosamine transferase